MPKNVVPFNPPEQTESRDSGEFSLRIPNEYLAELLHFGNGDAQEGVIALVERERARRVLDTAKYEAMKARAGR